MLAAEGDWQERLASAAANASGAVQGTASAVQQTVAGKLMVLALIPVLVLQTPAIFRCLAFSRGASLECIINEADCTSPTHTRGSVSQDVFGEPGRVQPHFGTTAARDLASQLQGWASGQSDTLSASDQPALLAALQAAAANLAQKAQVPWYDRSDACFSKLSSMRRCARKAAAMATVTAQHSSLGAYPTGAAE